MKKEAEVKPVVRLPNTGNCFLIDIHPDSHPSDSEILAIPLKGRNLHGINALTCESCPANPHSTARHRVSFIAEYGKQPETALICVPIKGRRKCVISGIKEHNPDPYQFD